MSEFAWSTRITGDEIITFPDGAIFYIKRGSSFMFLNISFGVK